MGNTQSVPEEAEDDNTCTVKSYQPLSDSPDSAKNGSVVFVQSPPPAVNEADAKAGTGRDKAAVPSPEPAEPSPGARAGGQGRGSAARRALPAARPRSILAFPWAVPGRAEEPAASPAPAEAAPDATELNKAPSEGSEEPAAHEGSHKNLGQAPPQDVELAGTPEGQDVATTKPRQVTLFERIFRLEKGKGRPQGDPKEGRKEVDVPNRSVAATAPNGVTLHKEIDECTQQEPGQDSAGDQGPAAAAPGGAQVEQDSPQAAAAQGSVMSFLKTLVSPSKAEAKSDSEGKAVKETPQTANTKGPEQPPAPCAKAERTLPAPQEPPAKQNPKAPEAAAPPQGVTGDPSRDKDKGSAPPLPLSKLFWKKNSSEEAEPVSNEKAEVALEVVAPDRDESKSTEITELKPRGAESKTPKANLRKFFKLSVKGDGGSPRAEEGDGASPRHHTLNATEKPLAPSESDPGGQRSKEGSKEKKSTLELGKQKGREQPEPREQPGAEPDSIHNGGDGARETSYKRAEKRQSLGGFFKGLGSKRTSDAEVQTDPVSILPAGKSK